VTAGCSPAPVQSTDSVPWKFIAKALGSAYGVLSSIRPVAHDCPDNDEVCTPDCLRCDCDSAMAMMDAALSCLCPTLGNHDDIVSGPELSVVSRARLRSLFARSRSRSDEMWLDAVVDAHGMGQEIAREQLEMFATENTALTNRVALLESEKQSEVQRTQALQSILSDLCFAIEAGTLKHIKEQREKARAVLISINGNGGY
jgi:hypothetical protein